MFNTRIYNKKLSCYTTDLCRRALLSHQILIQDDAISITSADRVWEQDYRAGLFVQEHKYSKERPMSKRTT